MKKVMDVNMVRIVHQLRKEGKTIRAIAEKLQKDRRQIFRWLKYSIPTPVDKS